MTPRKSNARPKALKPIVRSLIAKRAVENPTEDRRILAFDLIEEIKQLGEVPPTDETLIKYISEFRNKYIDDKPWTTASLELDLVGSEAIPLLIALQVQRKTFLSKPLTVREAKWFSRLYGFKDIVTIKIPEIKKSMPAKRLFTADIIASWAQIYAYRERIDIISGIKERDNADLDTALTTFDFNSVYQFNDKSFWEGIERIGNKDNITKEELNRFGDSYISPSVVDQIRFSEIRYLGHTLGDPDLNADALSLYGYSLTYIIINGTCNKQVVELPYFQRLRLFSYLREWFNDNPNEKGVSYIVQALIKSIQEENKK
jgi:hypothetical protein